MKIAIFLMTLEQCVPMRAPVNEIGNFQWYYFRDGIQIILRAVLSVSVLYTDCFTSFWSAWRGIRGLFFLALFISYFTWEHGKQWRNALLLSQLTLKKSKKYVWNWQVYYGAMQSVHPSKDQGVVSMHSYVVFEITSPIGSSLTQPWGGH